jgi:hypothetical protein
MSFLLIVSIFTCIKKRISIFNCDLCQNINHDENGLMFLDVMAINLAQNTPLLISFIYRFLPCHHSLPDFFPLFRMMDTRWRLDKFRIARCISIICLDPFPFIQLQQQAIFKYFPIICCTTGEGAIYPANGARQDGEGHLIPETRPFEFVRVPPPRPMS